MKKNYLFIVFLYCSYSCMVAQPFTKKFSFLYLIDSLTMNQLSISEVDSLGPAYESVLYKLSLLSSDSIVRYTSNSIDVKFQCAIITVPLENCKKSKYYYSLDIINSIYDKGTKDQFYIFISDGFIYYLDEAYAYCIWIESCRSEKGYNLLNNIYKLILIKKYKCLFYSICNNIIYNKCN